MLHEPPLSTSTYPCIELVGLSKLEKLASNFFSSSWMELYNPEDEM